MSQDFAPTATELFAVEDRLLSMYELRKSAGFDTDDIAEAYAVVAGELAGQGYFAKGLPAVDDGDGDDDTDDADQAKGASERRGKGGKKGSEAQDGQDAPKQTDGPIVKGMAPAWPTGTPKKGKGGNRNRTQRDTDDDAGEDGVGGEDKTLPDDGIHVKKGAAPAPKSAPKPAAPAQSAAPKPAAGPSPEGAPAVPQSPDEDHPQLGAQDVSQAADGAPGQVPYTPHPFSPSDAIASICATCGRPIADHVGKFLGADDSWQIAAEVVKSFAWELAYGGVDPSNDLVYKRDFTGDERQQYAANGVALPDGSFPIPDEASLHNAIRLVGHAHDPQAAMHHIIERAKTMGMEHALPPAWHSGEGDNAQQAPQPGAHSMTPEQPKAKGNMAKEIAAAFKKAIDAGHSTDIILKTLDVVTANDFEQFVVLKSAESRYTQGPIYMPGRLDAHQEWTTAEELQKALWDYVRETGADRRVYLQHTSKPAGEWVEAFQWHFPVQAQMMKSVNGVQKAVSVDLPAGTTYLGVVWEPWAYEMIKNEQITGLSMGGWAKRLEMALG